MSQTNLDDVMDLNDPEEKAYYDSILGDDIIEPDYVGRVYACDPDERQVTYIGKDKALVERKIEPDLHWSERLALGYSIEPREPFELGDQMADHSDDQGYDNFKEEGEDE